MQEDRSFRSRLAGVSISIKEIECEDTFDSRINSRHFVRDAFVGATAHKQEREEQQEQVTIQYDHWIPIKISFACSVKNSESVYLKSDLWVKRGRKS